MSDLPKERPANVTVIHPNCGALLAKVVMRLSGRSGVVSVIDSDRETLGVVDLGMHKRPEGVELRLVQEDLALIASGHSTLHHPLQDVIVVDGMVDHLPDRLVASLAVWCAEHLHPSGRAVFTCFGPSSDAVAFDHLVGWPHIRRTPGELAELLQSAGLSVEVQDVGDEEPHCGVVVEAVSAPGGLPRS